MNDEQASAKGRGEIEEAANSKAPSNPPTEKPREIVTVERHGRGPGPAEAVEHRVKCRTKAHSTDPVRNNKGMNLQGQGYKEMFSISSKSNRDQNHF